MRPTSQNNITKVAITKVAITKVAITKVAFIALFIVMLLMGCASENKKRSAIQIQTTSAAVKQAEEAGARDFSPIELRLSEQKLEKARLALKSKNYDRALRLSEQSEVDAALAEAKTRTAKAEKAVDELQQSIHTIKTEIDRATVN